MFYIVLLSLLVAVAARAQKLELRQVGSADTDVIEIAVTADLDDGRASGISVYVVIPDDAFAVVGAARRIAGQGGIRSKTSTRRRARGAAVCGAGQSGMVRR